MRKYVIRELLFSFQKFSFKQFLHHFIFQVAANGNMMLTDPDVIALYAVNF